MVESSQSTFTPNVKDLAYCLQEAKPKTKVNSKIDPATFVPDSNVNLKDYLCGVCKCIVNPDNLTSCRACEDLICTEEFERHKKDCPRLNENVEPSMHKLHSAVLKVIKIIKVKCPELL